jgi:hypothetical protein
MNDGAWRPVIVIGAPRSGTNLLRDLLCQAPGFGTWPCDEVNLLWRHGNARHPDDELTPALATPAVARHMRRQFAGIARRTGAGTVVEKTCANSLRVAFVDRILPEARYLFIVRDGRDAAASAVDRVSAPIDWAYTLRKLRYVPATDMPYYALQFARNRVSRLLRPDRRLAYWGPRFRGFADFARTASIPELCARQWRECVELATRDLAAIGARRVHMLRYEALVQRPRETIAEAFSFLGAPEAAAAIDVAHVTAGSIGRGRAELEAAGHGRALALMAPTLARLGYA